MHGMSVYLCVTADSIFTELLLYVHAQEEMMKSSFSFVKTPCRSGENHGVHPIIEQYP